MDEKLREVTIIPDFTDAAAGSVLISCGRTRVLCTASVVEGVPPFCGTGQSAAGSRRNTPCCPAPRPVRKARDGIKKDGRGVEIQRLIGRSLRAACDLSLLGERTIYIDCDVIAGRRRHPYRFHHRRVCGPVSGGGKTHRPERSGGQPGGAAGGGGFRGHCRRPVRAGSGICPGLPGLRWI